MTAGDEPLGLGRVEADDDPRSDLVETMGIEPTTPCLQIRKMSISASFGLCRIVSDCAI